MVSLGSRRYNLLKLINNIILIINIVNMSSELALTPDFSPVTTDDEMETSSQFTDYSSDNECLDTTIDLEKDIIDIQKELLANFEEETRLLRRENELLRLAMNKNIDNEKNMEKIMKFIKIVYGLTEIGYNSYTAVIIYGSLFEHFFAKKSFQDCELSFMFQHMTESNIRQIMERLDEMDYIVNEDFQVLQRMFVNRNQDMLRINYWKLKIKISEDLELDFAFHDNTYTNKVLFDSQKIVLTKQGFTVREFTENDRIYKNKHVSMSLLHSLNNLINNKVEITKTYNDFENLNEKYLVFDAIHQQNEYVLKNFEIKRGYNINESNDDETCSICYREHMEENICLYNLKCSHVFCSDCLYRHTFSHEQNNHLNCPLCRRAIELDINN